MKRVPLVEWDSMSALLERVEAGKDHALLIGHAVESPRKCHLFTVQSHGASYEIGVISTWFGIDPEAVLIDNEARVLVGHDLRITWLSLKPLALASSVNLHAPFYRFIPVGRDDEAIVLHELGLIRVHSRGSILWSVHTDVVEDIVENSDGSVLVTDMIGTKRQILLDSGRTTELP